MACFSAAIAEVAVVHVIKKRVEKNEAQNMANPAKIPLSTKLSWLITMLWGGIFLLAIEHIWHGEIVAYPPFLTAVADGNTHEMLLEIATIGGAIDIIIPAVWFLACMIVEKVRATRLLPQKA